MQSGGLKEIKRILSAGFYYDNLKKMEAHCWAEKGDDIIAAYMLGNCLDKLAQRVEDDPYDRAIRELEEKYLPLIKKTLDSVLGSTDKTEQDKYLVELVRLLL